MPKVQSKSQKMAVCVVLAEGTGRKAEKLVGLGRWSARWAHRAQG